MMREGMIVAPQPEAVEAGALDDVVTDADDAVAEADDDRSVGVGPAEAVSLDEAEVDAALGGALIGVSPRARPPRTANQTAAMQASSRTAQRPRLTFVLIDRSLMRGGVGVDHVRPGPPTPRPAGSVTTP